MRASARGIVYARFVLRFLPLRCNWGARSGKPRNEQRELPFVEYRFEGDGVQYSFGRVGA